MTTSSAFNKLYDYHVSLDKAYHRGRRDGYHNGYYGELYGEFVPYKKYKSDEHQKMYDKGYKEGYHEGWLDS